MARKPASMYRRLKGPAYTRRKYIGGVPNNRILAYHSGNRRAAETGGSQLSSNYVLTTTVRFDTLLLKQPVLFPTPQSVRSWCTRICSPCPHLPSPRLARNKQATGAGADRVSQGMRCAFGKNVGTLPVFDEVSESSRSTATQPTTLLRRMHSARQV